MVRGNPKWKKLPYVRSSSSSRAAGAEDMGEGAGSGGAGAQTIGLDSIMAELKSGFLAIEARFDAVTSRLDGMCERRDERGARGRESGGGIAKVEVSTATVIKRLERLKTRLQVMAIKNEDLETPGPHRALYTIRNTHTHVTE